MFLLGLLDENIEKIHFKKYRRKVTIDAQVNFYVHRAGTFKMARNKKFWSSLKFS
jgi:hypothetical protein